MHFFPVSVGFHPSRDGRFRALLWDEAFRPLNGEEARQAPRVPRKPRGPWEKNARSITWQSQNVAYQKTRQSPDEKGPIYEKSLTVGSVQKASGMDGANGLALSPSHGLGLLSPANPHVVSSKASLLKDVDAPASPDQSFTPVLRKGRTAYMGLGPMGQEKKGKIILNFFTPLLAIHS